MGAPLYRAVAEDGAAWITGASSGIGRAVAIGLAKAGWKVIASARRASELDELVAEASGLKGSIVAEPCDVTEREAISALVPAMEARHGPIVLAMLNVGTFVKDKEGTFGGDGFRRTFDVNIGGTINCLEPLANAMRARGRGQIAVTASVAGYGGLPLATAYSSTKSALIAMCESMKFDLDRQNIRIQVICPGFVRTPLTDKNSFPMPFMIEVEEAADRIVAGLAKNEFEIAFPRRMAWSLKLISMLPYSLYFGLLGRGTGVRRT